MSIVKYGMTFLDDTRNFSFESADVVMFGVACDLSSSYKKGAWYGPYALIDASYQVEFESPIFFKNLLDCVRIHNAGILECPKIFKSKAELDKLLRRMNGEVKRLSKKVFDNDKLLMLFGGDHSVPCGVFQAIADKFHPEDVVILDFDGHLDLRSEWDGTKFSHACIMRRARELGFRVVQVGPRDHISGEEADYIKKRKLAGDIFFCATQPKSFYWKSKPFFEGVFSADNLIHGDSLDNLRERIAEKASSGKYLWLSIDFDVFDSIPSTGTPLPCGLSFRAVRDAIFKVLETVKERGVCFLGFDICEVAPLQKTDSGYSVNNAVSVDGEMKAALLAYDILFWNFLDRFRNS